MNELELERRFSLNELLDLVSCGEVIRALAEMVRANLRIFDGQGQEVFFAGETINLCELIKATEAGDKLCQGVREKLLAQQLTESSAVQIQSACGLKYTVFPIRYQFENLGRVVLGPYQDLGMDNTKLEQLATKFHIDPKKFIQNYHQLPDFSPDYLKKLARFTSKFFDAFVFINAKRLVTTVMHLEQIMQSRDRIFKEMEKEAKGTPEDKKEIEKLKSMF